VTRSPACTLNGRALDPADHFDGTRITLPDLAADNELVVDAPPRPT
jgi:aminopeptidase N